MVNGERESQGLGRNQRNVALCLILAAVTLALFWPVTRAQFVNYDDPDFVTANPHVQHGFNWPDIQWSFKQLYPYWQPLTWFSYMADSAVYGLNASGFHFTNLILHLANSLLLYLVLWRMTRATWPSAAVAALFAWHPMHVETVAWVAERKGILCAFFWMLTLLAYERYSCKPTKLRYLFVALSFVLALLSKSMAVTLPCVLLLLDFWPLRRFAFQKETSAGVAPERPTFKPLQLLLEKLPLFCLSIASSIITVIAQKEAGALWATNNFSLGMRIGHAIVSYVIYLRKTIWPDDLAVFYPHPGKWPILAVVAAMVLLCGLTLFAFKTVRRFPYLAVGWLLFLGTLAPVIGIFQTGDQAMADRYSYLPLIGIFIIAAWGIRDLLSRVQFKGVYYGIASVIGLGGCLLGTSSQVQYWQNTRTLFAHACSVTENNFLAETIYGNVLFDSREFQEAAAQFSAALLVQPKYAEAHFGLAKVLVVMNQLPQAVEHYTKAIEANADYGEAHLGLAAVLFRLGEPDRASREYEAALKCGTASENLHLYIATEYLSRGKFAEAIQALEEAVHIKPDWLDALNRLAWLRATHPDPGYRKGTEALRLATRACEISHFQQAQALNTLAAAQAEVGQFSEAMATTRKALEVCRVSGETALVPIIEQLQRLYSQNQPYHEKPL